MKKLILNILLVLLLTILSTAGVNANLATFAGNSNRIIYLGGDPNEPQAESVFVNYLDDVNKPQAEIAFIDSSVNYLYDANEPQPESMFIDANEPQPESI